MTKFILSPIAAILLTAFATLLGPAAVEAAPLRIDRLKSSDVRSDGVFWVWFSSKNGSGKADKVAELDGATNELVLRVNGDLERFNRMSEKWTPRRQGGPRVGDSCEEEWANGFYLIKLSYKLLKSEKSYSAFAGKMTVFPSSPAFLRAGLKPTVINVTGETGS